MPEGVNAMNAETTSHKPKIRFIQCCHMLVESKLILLMVFDPVSSSLATTGRSDHYGGTVVLLVSAP